MGSMGDVVYDVCIVGGGMFGSAAARHASSCHPPLRVCLIGPEEPTAEERSRRDIFGAHYDEGRITRIIDKDLEYQIFAKHSIERYRELETNSGISFYAPVGCLFVGRKGGKFINSISEAGKKGGVPLIHFSHQTTLKERFPFLKMQEDECAFLDATGAGYISPRRMVQAQKRISESQGCKIIESVVVRVTQLKDGDVHEVVTETKGRIKSKRIIFATGAFINMKSLDTLKPIAIKRSRETVAYLEIPEEEAKRWSSMPAVIRRWEPDVSSASTIGAYILPPIKYPDGKIYLKYGRSGNPTTDDFSSLDEMKQWYLSEGDRDILNTHLDFVTQLLPGLKYKRVSTTPCVLSYTPSGFPYIDRISPTVTVALAGNGVGAKLSDEIGRLAAQLSIRGEWTADAEIEQEKFKVVLESTASIR